MTQQNLIPHLFRTEYTKITAVLCKLFGIEHIEIAEDIASDTFLLATEIWGLKGLPENPTAWLYTVAKNKAKDQLKRNAIFTNKIAQQIKQSSDWLEEIEIDLSEQNISDSQLQMMFAICNPLISAEEQIGLSLQILCGFGINEIAHAFLSNKETIKKRLYRAKEKLRLGEVKIELPKDKEINERLQVVLTTLYLLFNEGYYSVSKDKNMRKELCLEAMRLAYILIQNEKTNLGTVNALMALMCFQSSRLEARVNHQGETVLYQDQDESLWNKELIDRGVYFLNHSYRNSDLGKFHYEAGIAHWHTQKKDSLEKWEQILQLHNRLLQVEYSPMAALNRTYALSKARSKEAAIAEAEKLQLKDHHLYHALLGDLYIGIDRDKAHQHLQTAYQLAQTESDRVVLKNKILSLG